MLYEVITFAANSRRCQESLRIRRAQPGHGVRDLPETLGGSRVAREGDGALAVLDDEARRGHEVV